MIVLAKYGTSEKVLISCQKVDRRETQIKLGEQLGGEWILVEEFDPYSEYLHFDDGCVYKGFHGRDESYCPAIVAKVAENIEMERHRNMRVGIVGAGRVGHGVLLNHGDADLRDALMITDTECKGVNIQDQKTPPICELPFFPPESRRERRARERRNRK